MKQMQLQLLPAGWSWASCLVVGALAGLGYGFGQWLVEALPIILRTVLNSMPAG